MDDFILKLSVKASLVHCEIIITQIYCIITVYQPVMVNIFYNSMIDRTIFLISRDCYGIWKDCRGFAGEKFISSEKNPGNWKWRIFANFGC